MRDLLSKLDAILLESTTLQDLKQHPAADDPVIQRVIADKEKQQKDNTDESMFEIGDAFGISFSEDFEIGSEIVGFVADGIVIELDDHAIEMLTNEGLQFFEGELVEDLDEGRGTCWVGYEQKGMKKKGSKMVANCVKEDEVAESGLQYHTGVKKHGKEYMVKAAAAGREGASQEELGRLKDRYSKAEKNKPQKEDHGPENPDAPVNYGEYDREGDMAKDDLRTIDDAVEELYSILRADDNLPEWVQSKITKAVDYIDTARDYMKAQKYEEGVAEGLPQTLRKVVPGYAKREIDKKMDDQKFGRTDVDRDANYYRYKKIQDKIKDKGVAESEYPDTIKKIQIRSRFDDSVLYSHTSMNNTVARTVLAAIDDTVALASANLRGADLRGIDLRLGEFQGADLRNADLRGADLRGTDLRDADLSGANVVGAKTENKQGGAEGDVTEAEYQGRTVQLGKKMAGDVKKSKVYVKNPQGNVVKVNFGDKKMRIKKSNPARRKSFRARHNCANPGPRHKARYWSCRSW